MPPVNTKFAFNNTLEPGIHDLDSMFNEGTCNEETSSGRDREEGGGGGGEGEGREMME